MTPRTTFRPAAWPPAGGKIGRVSRVLVADDHPLFRAGVVAAIADAGDLELVGEAGEGEETLRPVAELDVDVAIVDVRMPNLSGIEICRRLRDASHPAHVLLLSANEDPGVVRQGLEAGAAGFLSKEEADEAIVDAVRRAANGETVVSTALQAALLAHMAGRSVGPVRLSESEQRALALAAEGLSNGEIGQAMFVSGGTVKTYLARAFAKLGVSDRAAAVAEAVRRGLIS